MTLIAPSILSANLAQLARDVRLVADAGADWIHVDVMDGHFVPNITMGPLVVEALQREVSIPLDVHLMITDPDRYLDAFIDAGADVLSVHVETGVHLHRTVQAIKRRGIMAGVVLNPATPLVCVEHMLPDVDMILIMTVNPGFGGQEFIPGMLAKIRRLRETIDGQGLPVKIEVDGGIKEDNIADIAEAGADILVAGSGIFATPDPAETLRRMRTLLTQHPREPVLRV